MVAGFEYTKNHWIADLKSLWWWILSKKKRPFFFLIFGGTLTSCPYSMSPDHILYRRVPDSGITSNLGSHWSFSGAWLLWRFSLGRILSFVSSLLQESRRRASWYVTKVAFSCLLRDLRLYYSLKHLTVHTSYVIAISSAVLPSQLFTREDLNH